MICEYMVRQVSLQASYQLITTIRGMIMEVKLGQFNKDIKIESFRETKREEGESEKGKQKGSMV